MILISFQFAGKWFVLQKFRTTSDCITEDIVFENGTYYLNESIRPMSAHVYATQKATLFSDVDEKYPARMKVEYPISE